jgi:hypothetical protein
MGVEDGCKFIAQNGKEKKIYSWESFEVYKE